MIKTTYRLTLAMALLFLLMLPYFTFNFIDLNVQNKNVLGVQKASQNIHVGDYNLELNLGKKDSTQVFYNIVPDKYKNRNYFFEVYTSPEVESLIKSSIENNNLYIKILKEDESLTNGPLTFTIRVQKPIN